MGAMGNRLVSTALALLWVASGPTLPQEAPAGFARAETARELIFPADHGSHPEFATEWWYLTGSLTSADGDLFGFQATWFRSALVPEPEPRVSTLAVRDVILFHGGLIDVERQAFFSESRASRAASASRARRPSSAATRSRTSRRVRSNWPRSKNAIAIIPQRTARPVPSTHA